MHSRPDRPPRGESVHGAAQEHRPSRSERTRGRGVRRAYGEAGPAPLGGNGTGRVTLTTAGSPDRQRLGNIFHRARRYERYRRRRPCHEERSCDGAPAPSGRTSTTGSRSRKDARWNRGRPVGSRDGVRPVPRAARGALAGDAHARPDVRVADRGGRGDQLVRAAALDRAGPRGSRDHRGRAARGVQALLDGSRVPAPPAAGVAVDRRGRALPPGRDHGQRRRGRGGRRGGAGRGDAAAATDRSGSAGCGERR